jgi:hypothetical protein
MQLDHREQDNVESKPPSGLNSGGASHCGYRQVGEHRPHVDTPHDQNYESSYSLDNPQPGVEVIKIDCVPPHRFLFMSTEGKLAGCQHKMSQHSQGNQWTADLSHVSGFKEMGDPVHYPTPEPYKVEVNTGYQNHMAPHKRHKPDSGKHLEKIQIRLSSNRFHSSNSLIRHHLPSTPE